MPVKRRVAKRRDQLSDGALKWLRNESTFYGLINADDMGWDLFERAETLAAVWAENRNWVVAEHVAAKPGTRPARWWDYDAPRLPGFDGKLAEHRRQVGGSGRQLPACLPQSKFGIPMLYDVDPDDAPIFESEAAYLDRHGLFLAGERRRVKHKDFEPAAIMTTNTEDDDA